MPKAVRQSPKKAKKKAAKKPSVKLPAEIQPLGAGLDEYGWKILLYGASGTGKTTLWATFPGPILVLVCTGSAQPGELRSVNTPEYREKIFQWVINDVDDLSKAADYCAANADKFKTVVLDHGSGLSDMTLKGILKIDKLPPQLAWGTATQSQWGQLGLQMKERLRCLLDLPQHVIIVAHERDFSSDDDDERQFPTVGGAFTPTVTGWLNANVDYIWQTFKRSKTIEKEVDIAGEKIVQRIKTGETEFCLRTGPDAVYTTKFRVPKGTPLPPIIEDPEFEKLEDLLS